VAVVVGLAIRPPNSLRDLATALGARHGPGEPVYMLGNYYFDVPFYARLRAPTGVVDHWQRADVATRDNWRKELADASQFAHAAAAQALVLPDDLAAWLCGSAVSWVIGPAAAAGQYPFLQAAAFVSSTGDARLWRVETAAQSTRTALGCRGQVHGGPADR
jgi:hypothetical protein